MGWPLESHELTLRMSRTLFKQLSSKAAADNVRRTYLTPEFEEWMRSVKESKEKEGQGGGGRSKKRSSGAGLDGEEVEITPAKKKNNRRRSRSEEPSNEESAGEDREEEKQPRRCVLQAVSGVVAICGLGSNPFPSVFYRNAGRKARATMITEASSSDEDDKETMSEEVEHAPPAKSSRTKGRAVTHAAEKDIADEKPKKRARKLIEDSEDEEEEEKPVAKTTRRR